MTFKKDFSYGTNKEEELFDILSERGYELQPTGDTDIHDLIFSKDGKKYTAEIKSRRCLKETYTDTLIGANKLGEAWNKFYSSGIETIFFFFYEDGIYFIKPFNNIPRREHKLQRWDRGIDKPKGWLYYPVEDLIHINEL